MEPPRVELLFEVPADGLAIAPASVPAAAAGATVDVRVTPGDTSTVTLPRVGDVMPVVCAKETGGVVIDPLINGEKLFVLLPVD